jgi:hypothetical protein
VVVSGEISCSAASAFRRKSFWKCIWKRFKGILGACEDPRPGNRAARARFTAGDSRSRAGTKTARCRGVLIRARKSARPGGARAA